MKTRLPSLFPRRPAPDVSKDSSAADPGPRVWLHVGGEDEALGVPDLIGRLSEERDDLCFLITIAERGPDELLAARLPRDTEVVRAPAATAHSIAAFLARWQPALCIWAAGRLEPGLIAAADRAGVALFLVDARLPEPAGWRWLPGQWRGLLRRFTFVIAADSNAAEGLIGLGVPADRVETMGALQVGNAPLPCSAAERDTLAGVLAARPVWLAAGVTASEIASITDAHRQAIRRAHRLLLVIQPEDLADGPALAARLEAEGWATGLRSRDADPEPEIEIFVADLPDELGLWYRLSPIALMGGSLAGDSPRTVKNPFEAAALGSAVLYGPHLGPWAGSYDRLRGAGAARAVTDCASLARAVEFLLAPDMVAAMATAAWDLTTSGAEATDRIVALALDALDARGL